MIEPNSERQRNDGEVVYRRIVPGSGDENVPKNGPAKSLREPSTGNLTPTLRTVLVGFILLLALVLILGFLSVRKMEAVGLKILDDERRHVTIRGFALELRNAATKLDNEARARGRNPESETVETRPLFDLPLTKARAELRVLLRQLTTPPYSDSEKWRNVVAHLVAFDKATENSDEYRVSGYVKFRELDREINDLLEQTRLEQEDIFNSSADLQRSAARWIYFLTAFAFLIGAAVAAYTIWEMQRRFRQVRESIEEARREREFSTQMLEGMVSAIAAIDAHDRIRSANGAFFKIFPEARVGTSVHDKFSSPEAMRMLESATSSRVSRATYRGRWVCGDSAPGCSDKTFDVYSSPLTIEDEHGQIVTLVDVTDAAEAESVLRRTESLTAMGQAVAQVAHEIKNPLGSIRLGVSMLRDTSTDEESISTIDLVERGIRHLNKLVVDVTNFSRQRPLEISEVDLHSLIDSSLELVTDVIQEKHARIEKDFSREPLLGDWDVDQLRQVFVNVVANAIDASGDGESIKISTQPARSPQNETVGGNGNHGTDRKSVARIIIEDHGTGMDESTLSRLFEPFFTTKKRGTGLGLAIVKKIIDHHQGTISAESSPGNGTRFTIDLPRKA
ncbi:MAG: two-component system, NtrC family, sensor histidine kinase HydH [Acidobacteriota bacterium]|nr:two-component system, NtrC family, sensor histidine kinase HydH [Acidobacteriota bacterium]